MGAAKMMLPRPEQRRALAKAGVVLRQMREAAGMSAAEVLNFTRAAFGMALAFRAAKPPPAAAPQRRKGKSS
jgi:hypothetical protein